jgi:signal peptidase II
MVLVIVFVILSLDQLSKFFINRNLELNHSIPLIKGFFSITLVHNRGAAFGMFKGKPYLFIIASVVAVILIPLILRKNKGSRLYTVALSLVLAGAIGNLIDRIFLGYVIDFLDFQIWPVFNLADSSITLGAILLGWLILTSNKKNVSANM